MTSGRNLIEQSLSRRELLRRTGGVAVATLAAPLVAACAPQQGGAAPSATPSQEPAVKGGNLIDARNVEDPNLNPMIQQLNGALGYAMFEGLLAADGVGNLVPVLAKSMPNISSDGLTYTFDLRQDAKWTDGMPLTADDVVFTYRAMYHPDYKAFPSYRRAVLEGTLADVSAPDPYTVVMKTKRQDAGFLTNQTRDLVLPKHVLGSVAPAALAAHPFNTAPTVSAGPFKFKEWKSGDHMTGVRNDGYYRGAPYLDSYTVKLIPDQSLIVNQLKTGEVDLTGVTGPFSAYDQLKAEPSLNVVIYNSPGQGPRVWYNLEPTAPASKIFADKAVRQALWYAADLAGINNAALLKYGALPSSTGVFPPYRWPNNPSPKIPYSFDKAKAESLLDAAGWKRNSSGIRMKDGVALKFELMNSADNLTWLQIGEILQQNWKDIGADVAIRPLRFAQLVTASLNREFDVLMQSLPYAQAANPDPDPSEAFHSRSAVKGGRNYSNYKDPQVDSLLDQAAVILDQAKRKDLYFQLQDILNDYLPSFATPFWQYCWVYNKRVVGIGGDRIGTFSGTARWFGNEIWVRDGK